MKAGRKGGMTDWLGPRNGSAVALSLRVSFVGHAGQPALGVLVAYGAGAGAFRGRTAAERDLVHLPLILPPVVTGYLLLADLRHARGCRQPAGSGSGIVFAFRWTGAALAAAIMAFPLMVRAIRLAIEAVDPKLEQAAAHPGRFAPLGLCLTVTLPLILPGIIAGAILAFAKAMGEFGATITFVSNIPGQTQTLPSAIYAFLQVPGGEAQAMRLVLVSAVAVAWGACWSEWAAGRWRAGSPAQ
jgi:molybdate transport system permease protein